MHSTAKWVTGGQLLLHHVGQAGRVGGHLTVELVCKVNPTA